MTRKQVMIMAGSVFGIVSAGILLPALAPPTNCGGNSSALGACKAVTLGALIARSETHGDFLADELDSETATELSRAAGTFWVQPGSIRVRRAVRSSAAPDQIVTVCTQPYSNVPQPWWWNGYKRTPAHAAGLADGRTRLLSPEEFARLDLSLFADVTTLTNRPTLATP